MTTTKTPVTPPAIDLSGQGAQYPASLDDERFTPNQYDHPAYAAILAKARELGLPHAYRGDLLHDRTILRATKTSVFGWRVYVDGSDIYTEHDLGSIKWCHAHRQTEGYSHFFWWDGEQLEERPRRQIERDLRERYDAQYGQQNWSVAI